MPCAPDGLVLMRSHVRRFALAALVALAGCGGSDGAGALPTGACTPGASRSCSCDSGIPGQELCERSGRWAACTCATAARDAGVDGAGADHVLSDLPPAVTADADLEAPAAPTDTAVDRTADVMVASEVAPASGGCVPARKLAGGKERVLDAFVLNSGIIIVRNDALVLVGRDGVEKMTVTTPRPITSVAFDGTTLVTADAAMLTVYGTDLASQGTVLLTEACASSVLVDGGIFVCGPANDWDRVFYTYDVRNRRPIAAASKKYTYNGIPMRRVPNTNYFVTVTTSSSPSDFHLYRVEPNGADVVFVNESPYHGDFPATEIYGFAGTPPTHLVNLDGLLLRLFGNNCDSMHNSFTSGCFVKDGNLGTLWMTERFASLSNDEPGNLYAVVAGSGSSFFDPACVGGCSLQKIDVASRKVVSQKKHMLAARRFLFSRPDTTCNMVVVGYEVATSTSSSSLDYSGYQIDLLDYGSP